MRDIECKYCGHNEYTVRNGIRRTDKGTFQRFFCQDCQREFSVSLDSVCETSRRIPKVLLLDIETAPMEVCVWGLYKQYIPHKNVLADWFILSWAAKWLYGDKVMSAVVKSSEAVLKDDLRVLVEVWKLLDDADIVIGHNVDKFDIRKLNTRFLHHGMTPPSPYQTIDTMRVAMKNFAMTSFSQDWITKWLHLPEKLKTDFELWLRCMKGDSEALQQMVTYNRGDVIGLEEVYYTLRPWIKSHPNMGLYVNANEPVCPNCGGSSLDWQGYYYTPAGKYRAFRCECGAIGRSRFAALNAEQRQKLTVSVAR